MKLEDDFSEIEKIKKLASVAARSLNVAISAKKLEIAESILLKMDLRHDDDDRTKLQKIDASLRYADLFIRQAEKKYGNNGTE